MKAPWPRAPWPCLVRSTRKTSACCVSATSRWSFAAAPHVGRSGDIGFFKITSEGGVAAGVRRIEAITGEAAVEYVEQSEALLKDVAGLLRGSREDLRDKVRDALESRAPDGERGSSAQG